MGLSSAAFEAVLRARQTRLPPIETEIDRWKRVQLRLTELERAMAGLTTAELDGTALGVSTTEMQGIALECLSALASVRTRMARTTVNLGVGGAARNGKSTLLQAFTGLGDDQIPTGSGLPVTAVRSRIFHSTGRGRALITLHSERSFLDEAVAPFHAELRLGPEPRTIEEFRACRYPLSEDELAPEVRRNSGETNPMRQRLLDMQSALGSYCGLLTGETRELSLDELRPWVAYPAGDGDPAPARWYLAVREARIECPFPLDDVSALACLDLPGLGEIVPNAEEHHLHGLQNEVDLVLLVKRPLGNTAYWEARDGRAISLITRARGPVSARDFAFIVINSGGCDPEDVTALRAHIQNNVNEGTDGKRYTVVTADVKDPEQARELVLRPVLAHLADRLGTMDQAVLDDARERCDRGREQILAPVARALETLRRVTTPTSTEELLRRARQLRVEVTRSLQTVIRDLEKRVLKDPERGASGPAEDAEYLAEVELAHRGVREWISSGFGEGEDAWCARALDSMALDDASAPFAVEELNRIRIEMGRRFGAIDGFLTRRRDEFWERIGAAVGARLFGPAMAGTSQDRLKRLSALFLDAPDPCPALAAAVEQVLDVRLDYRTRVFPQMVRAFNLLRAEGTDPRSREVVGLLTVSRDSAGARELFGHVQRLARQAAYEAKSALMEEIGTAAVVLLAYARQFEDTLIRSAESEAEFCRIAEAYRDELWPGEFTHSGLANTSVQRVRHALRVLSEELTSALGIPPGRPQPTAEGGPGR